MKKIQPEIIFHLAAQPIVRRSYAEPLETFNTNAVGTANLLESVRRCLLYTSVSSQKPFAITGWFVTTTVRQP